MKRTIILLAALALFLAACASTSPTPDVRGVITEMSEGTLTVTPIEGGEPATVNVGYSTQVIWHTGLKAQRSSLVTGQPVKIWLRGGTQDAARIVIAL